MKIFSHLSKKFKKKTETTVEETTITEAFKKRYSVFQNLLASNNKVLELMADMEEKLSGEFLFDNRYINENASALSAGVKDIIDNMNEISKNKYSLLYKRYDSANSEIEKILSRKREIPESPYTINFDAIYQGMVDKVGGKNAHLGEARNSLNLPTPDGFAVSAFAFKRFMEYNGFMQKINEMLSGIKLDSLQELNHMSKGIQDMVAGGEIPDDLREELEKAVESLKVKVGDRVLRVSVRSSALQEDGEFSFAGQYATFLNVSHDAILQKYKEVIASLFTARAIFYFKAKGFQEHDMVMSVGILKMVDAKAGGVLYTRDPNRPDVHDIIVSAVHGLGVCVVDGTITPEIYVVSRQPRLEIVSRHIPHQKTMLFCRLDGGVEEIPLPHDAVERPCLTDDQAMRLAEYALSIENHYQRPQDIEWALDENNNLFILQTRPLRILTKEAAKPIPTYVPGYNILIDKGIIACKGIGSGKVHIVRTDDDLENFPDKAVLVARHTSPKYVKVMNKASAIVTDSGGTTGHMASLTREFQVPAILDTEVGTKTLQPGQEITVDAFNCTIYDGRVNELIELAGKRENPFKDTLIFKTLKNVLKWVAPLNLYDPAAENFKPEFCATFHDITRFCHEMAMNEMFQITDVPTDEIGKTQKLIAGIPIVIHIIDLGDGVKEGHPEILKPEHIQSEPLNAFVKGLVAMKWPQGRPIDIKGFLGMMAHTASIPEEELLKTGDKSFTFISKSYMNFLLRLGYHLSTVEAFAGENLNDNYIRFFFKGGGAAVDRRLRRVRLITEILRKMDFEVTVKDDVVDAVFVKYKQSTIEGKLEALGKLTAYTKQLDMVMYNDAITDMYIEEFVREHVKKGNRE